MSHVVKKWVSELPWKQQGVLLCACRGVDGFPKNHVSKPLTRLYRQTILNCADLQKAFSGDSFMGVGILSPDAADDFIAFQLDSYPMHWLLHFTHAIEIIGYKHPDLNTRVYWMHLYVKIVKALHLNPETKDQLDFRLQDGDRERE